MAKGTVLRKEVLYQILRGPGNWRDENGEKERSPGFQATFPTHLTELLAKQLGSPSPLLLLSSVSLRRVMSPLCKL